MENKELETWQKEAEFSPKRGDRVLVWDFKGQEPKERIFLSKDGHFDFPILAVKISDKHKFKQEIFGYKHMKPLSTEQPTEQPTEADFKSQVIELIEKRIKEYEFCERECLEMLETHSANELRAVRINMKNLLRKIKQLC